MLVASQTICNFNRSNYLHIDFQQCSTAALIRKKQIGGQESAHYKCASITVCLPECYNNKLHICATSTAKKDCENGEKDTQKPLKHVALTASCDAKHGKQHCD